MRSFLAAACFAAVLLAGCGGRTAALAPEAPLGTGPTGAPVNGSQSVRVTLVLGGKSGRVSSAVRRPRFVSPSTMGFDLKVFAHGGNTIIGESETDISSGSPACGGQTGLPRTCTISVAAPPGDDDFVGTTNRKPVNNSFASGHRLGFGTLTATIVAGANNGFTLFLSGVINSLGFLAPNASLAADGVTNTFGFVLNPSDFDNNPITAGANDPYQNPISVQLTESGGSGHAQIVKNGTPTGGTSTMLNQSTDTVAVQYDGGGAPGYDVTVNVSATGVTPETLVISPLYATTSSPYLQQGPGVHRLRADRPGELGRGARQTPRRTRRRRTRPVPASRARPRRAGRRTRRRRRYGGFERRLVHDRVLGRFEHGHVDHLGLDSSGSVTIPSGALGPIVFNGHSNGPIQGQTDPASGKPWLSNSCSNNDYSANVVNTSSYRRQSGRASCNRRKPCSSTTRSFRRASTASLRRRARTRPVTRAR